MKQGFLLATVTAAAVAALSVPQEVRAEAKCVRVVSYDWAEQGTIDPALPVHGSDSMHAWAFYEPLVWLGPGYELIPHLAESWEPNATGTEWTFHLRRGVKFHDGSDFDAGDVIYTYRRLVNPETASPGLAQLQAFLTPESISAPDAHTVAFKTARPYAELPLLISEEFSLIVPEGATDEQIRTRANGTGPFILEGDFAVGTPRTVIKRNPNYWRAGLPEADCVELSGIEEPVTRATALMGGEVDVLTAVDATTLVTMKGSPEAQLISGTAGTMLTLSMFVDTPPFNDVRVRQAMKLVIDREAIVQTALLGFGEAGNDNPIPPSSPEAFRTDVIQRDVGKAKALLAEAGHADGLNIDVYTGASDLFPGTLAMVQAYKEMAAEAGINVNIITRPADSFWDDTYLKVPLVTSYWYMRPSALALPIGYRTDAKYNETHWYRADFDALLDKAEATVDPAARVTIYKEAQRILSEEGGVIVPAFAKVVAAVRKGCSGYTPQVDLNRIDLSTVTCE